MILEPNAIVPEALHKKVGWDIRHHFMAEKIIDRFGLQLPRDRELIRQLAVIYVLTGLKTPPREARRSGPSVGEFRCLVRAGRQADKLKDHKEGEESEEQSNCVVIEPPFGNREKPHDSCTADGANDRGNVGNSGLRRVLESPVGHEPDHNTEPKGTRCQI